MFVEIVNRDDIGMREPRNQASLQVETLDKVAVGCIPGRKNLHRNFAIEILLICSIYMGHTSLTEWGKDFIVPKRCTNQRVFLHSLVRRLSSQSALTPRKD